MVDSEFKVNSRLKINTQTLGIHVMLMKMCKRKTENKTLSLDPQVRRNGHITNVTKLHNIKYEVYGFSSDPIVTSN